MKRSLVYLIACVLLLTACSPSALSIDRRWASVQGGRIEKAQAGEEFYFTVPVEQNMLETVPVHIQVSGSVTQGSLRFELRDPGGQAVWNSGTIGPGGFSMTTDYQPTRTGEYKLGLVYGDQTAAGYDLAWRALNVGPGVLLPGIGMLLVAAGFTFWGARRHSWGKREWQYVGLGALLWAFTVAVKFAWAVPVNPLVYQALKVSKDTLFAPGNLAAYVYIGALTGIFEAGLAWLVLRRRRWGKATWAQALAFGIGFGGVEALLLGLSSLGAGLAALAAPGSLPVPTLAGIAHQATPVIAAAPVVERLFVIFGHICAGALIFYAITTRQIRWVLWAVLYKTALDTPAGFAAFWGAGTPEKLWTVEALVAAVGLVGLLGTVWVARRYPREEGVGGQR